MSFLPEKSKNFAVILIVLLLAGGIAFKYSAEQKRESSWLSQNELRSGQKAVKFPGNPVLSYGQHDPKLAANHIAGNCVFKNEQNETLVLYYKNVGYSSGPVSTVGLAKSSDNVHFKTVQDKVLLPGKDDEWDGGSVSVHPGCIAQRKDGTYYLYYSGSAKGAPDFYYGGKGGIGLAFSKDLLHWTKFEHNPILTRDQSIAWESEGVFEPSVIFSGDEYGSPSAFKMWYGGNGKEGRMSIGYAESYDGTNWAKSKANPVLSFSAKAGEFDAWTIEVHQAIKLNNEYILAYEATDTKFPSRFKIGLASSKDGLVWHKSPYNPLLEEGPVGAWDAMGAYHPAFLIDGKKILMYYVGLNAKYDHQIGIAEINPFYLYHVDDLVKYQ